jgi:hypothetical protein
LITTHQALLDSHKPIIDALRDQQDRYLAHLDQKNVKPPEWRERQPQLDLGQVEKLYRDLVGIMVTYYRLFYGGRFDFGDWESISKIEMKYLFEYYEAYLSKA